MVSHRNLTSVESVGLYARFGSVTDVRFGSKADMCVAKRHVRFTPNSDRESEIPQKAMSALPPKADMCSAVVHVRFWPKADIGSVTRSPHRRPLAALVVL